MSNKKFARIIPIWNKLKLSLDHVFLMSAISAFSATILYFVIKTSAFVRLYGDDYCTSGILKRLGFWQSQVYWYNSWSGRYSYNLLVHFSELFRLSSVELLPGLLFVILSISFAWLLIQIFGKRTASVITCLAIGLLFTSLMVINSPNIYQTLYWQTGSLTYFVPFIFLNIVLGIVVLLYKNNKYFNIPILILIFSLAFFAGGFAESYVALQITILSSLVIIMSLLWRKRKPIIAVSVALAASVLSMLITMIAPGNKIRQAQLPSPQPIIGVIKGTVEGMIQYFQSIGGSPKYLLALTLVFIIGLYLVIRVESNFKIAKINIVIMASLLLLMVPILSVGSIYAPGLYALSTNPPARTLFMAEYPLIICSFAIGLVIGAYMKKYAKSDKINAVYVSSNVAAICIFGIIMLMLAPVINTSRETFSNVKEYSRQWDSQVVEIKNQLKSKDLSIRWIQPIGELPDPQQTSKGWVNICMSDYYGVNSITAVHR